MDRTFCFTGIINSSKICRVVLLEWTLVFITVLLLIEIPIVESRSKQNCIQLGKNKSPLHKFQWKNDMKNSNKFDYWNKNSTIFRPIPFIASGGTGSRWISKMIGGAIGMPGLETFLTLLKEFKYKLIPCSNDDDTKKSKTEMKQNLPGMLVKFHFKDYKSKLYKNTWKNQSLDSIVLFRNPYHSIVSNVQHRLSGPWNNLKPSNLTKILSNTPKRIEKAFKEMSRDYISLYTSWLKDCIINQRKIIILFYEDVVKDSEINLIKILLHFNITDNVPERINASLQDLKSSNTNTWKRSDKFQDNKVILSKYLKGNTKLQKKIKNGIKRIKDLLVKLKYPDTGVNKRFASYNT